MARSERDESAMPDLQSQEFELKLAMERPGLEALALQDCAGDWTLSPPRRAHLRSVYYDSADGRLRGAALTLRIRQDGAGFIQTVKSGAGLIHGLSTPQQFETPLNGPDPDLAAIPHATTRQRATTALGKRKLVALFETDVTRMTRIVSRGGAVLELALDEGEIRAGGRSQPIQETELELKSGAARDMIPAARALFEAHAFHLSRASKAERGYALAADEADPPASAAPAMLADADLTCRDALMRLVMETAAQVEAGRAVATAGDDPEGAHQIRVGLRRLRTALRAFRPLLRGAGDELAALAADLARIVGELRDADVLLDEICTPLAREEHEEAGFASLRQILSGYRVEKRAATRAALHGPVWRRFQLELALWPMRLPQAGDALDRPVGGCATRFVDRAWTKASRRARRIASLDVAARHELRKALKNLRYTAEFFEGLYPPERVKPFTKHLKRLQDDFGYLNDSANAGQIVNLVRARAAGDAAAREAAGFVLGWHTSRAETCWGDAQREWAKLKTQPKFWR